MALFLCSMKEVRTLLRLDDDGEEETVNEDENEDSGAEEEGQSEGAKPTPEELLAQNPELAELIAKQVQSEADKRLANYQAKLAREQRERDKMISQAERQRRIDEALEQGDTDTARALREQEKTSGQERLRILGEIEDALKVHPALVSELGEDTVVTLYNQTIQENGDLVEWLYKLANEKQTREVKKMTEQIREELQKEYEAKLIEAGVEVRSQEEEEGKSPSEALSKGGITGSRKSLIDAAAAGEDVSMEALRQELKKRGIDPLKY